MRKKLLKTAVPVILALLLQSFAYEKTENKVASRVSFNKITFSKAGKNAKAQKKMIFVIIQAEWCGACKKMQKITANDSVGKFYNERFISIKFNADNLWQYYRASNWGITSVPAMIYLDERRNVIHKVEGFRDAAGLIKEANTAIEKRRNPQKKKTHLFVMKSESSMQPFSLLSLQ